MQYEELCREVERQLQFQPKARTDFDYVAEKVHTKTKETVSANTLMRLWGYRESVNARRSTLDILSRYVGYEDYAHFVAARGVKEEEEEEKEKTLSDPKTLPDPPLKGGGQEVEQEEEQEEGEDSPDDSPEGSPEDSLPIKGGKRMVVGVKNNLVFAKGNGCCSCWRLCSDLPCGATSRSALPWRRDCLPEQRT